MLNISLEMEVAFYAVDSYKIAWHGSYPKFFEMARCKLLELLDFTYVDMEKAGYFFPIIDLQIKYIKPLKFGQQFVISATLKEWKNKLIINYLIVDKQSGERLTKGSTTQVAVAMPSQITQFASPDILLEKVEKAISQYEHEKD